MEKKFSVKKHAIETDIQLIEKGIESIQHDLDYLNSKGEEPTPVEKATLRGKELQQERRIKELSVKWLEFLLEYMDYYKMNRLHAHPFGSSNIKREFSEFQNVLHRYMDPTDFEGIQTRAGRGLQQFVESLRK